MTSFDFNQKLFWWNEWKINLRRAAFQHPLVKEQYGRVAAMAYVKYLCYGGYMDQPQGAKQ